MRNVVVAKERWHHLNLHIKETIGEISQHQNYIQGIRCWLLIQNTQRKDAYLTEKRCLPYREIT